MKILFVHQGFPGQYKHILEALSSQGGHQIVGMGLTQPSEQLPAGVYYKQYSITRGNTHGIHPWVIETESKVLRGEACANAALDLRQQGFTPQIICAHPGWGESLFLKDIWPNVPLLCYQEFFYQPCGFDFDFDFAIQGSRSWQDQANLRMKNANILLSLQVSDWNITPTSFQLSTFPSLFHSKFSCIHDGVDTQVASPDPAPSPLSLPDGSILHYGDQILTFVNRNIEPYRGCHTFLRSLPQLLALHPQLRVVIVGNQHGVSYGNLPPEGSWKLHFLKELKDKLDFSRVYFTGSIPYTSFLHLLRLSSVHVYLTYPFVLSWSLLEAMSCQTAIVASETDPVKEVIVDGHNGLLVDFFDPNQLANSVSALLSDSDLRAHYAHSARQTILDRYDLRICLPQQLSLINSIVSGKI